MHITPVRLGLAAAVLCLVGVAVRLAEINQPDAVSGFQFNTASADAGDLVGKAPAPGEESMAAWFRLVPANGKQASALRVGKVEVLR